MWKVLIRVYFAAILAGLMTPAYATLRGDCRDAQIVKSADVNVVIMEYGASSANSSVQEAEEKLLAFIEFDALLSVIQYRDAALIELRRPQEPTSLFNGPCAPELVADRLFHQLEPGHSIIFLWGNLFSDDDAIFVQSFIEVRRASPKRVLSLSWRRDTRDYQFTATLPVTRAAFPLREVSLPVIERLSELNKTLLAHEQPDPESTSRPLYAERLPQVSVIPDNYKEQ